MFSSSPEEVLRIIRRRVDSVDRLLQGNASIAEIEQSKRDLYQVEINFHRMQSAFYVTTWRNTAKAIATRICNLRIRLESVSITRPVSSESTEDENTSSDQASSTDTLAMQE